MNQLSASIVSALVGGCFGALAGWWTGRRQAKSNRAWEIAFIVSGVLAEILSVSTPRFVKTIDDIERLQREWDIAHRRFYILGHQDAANSLTTDVNKYLDALRACVKGELSPEATEARRRETREAVTALMREFARG